MQTNSPGEAEKPKGDMERLREILFGGQMRENEARFEMMEQAYRAEVGAMRREMERQVGEMREELEAEMTRLRGEVEHEAAERRRALGELTEQTRLGFSNVEAALRTYEARVLEAEKKFQEGMIEKTQFIHEEVQASVKSLTQYLDVQTRELKETKLDRADLSKALEFVAGGLAPKREGQTGFLGRRPV